MLTVKTYLAPSALHGIGLFTAESIPANTTVWQYDEHVARINSEYLLLDIGLHAHKQSLHHLKTGSYKTGLEQLCEFFSSSESDDRPARNYLKQLTEGVCHEF